MSERSNRWCFTINNFTQEEEEAVMNLPEQHWVKSVIAEEEHLDEGTPHIQGFMILNERKYLSWLKNAYFGPRIHLEVARGTTKQAWDYCTKEGNIIIEYNKPDTVDRIPHRSVTQSQQETHSFLEACKTYTQDQIMEEFPCLYARYHHLFEKLHSEYAIRSIDTYDGRLHDKNLWIYGPPGSGKTTFALSGIPRYKIYLKRRDRWWDNFDISYHERILIDEWAPLHGDLSHIMADYVKHWGDRFPYSAEVKCGSTVINPNIPVIITSNFSIDQCFDDPADAEAIHRRFREVYWDGHNIEMYSECPYYGHYLGQVSPAPRPQPAQIPQRPVTPQSAQYSEYQTDDEDSIVEEDNPFDTPLNTSIRPDSIPPEYEMSPLDRRIMELAKEREMRERGFEPGIYN